MSLGEGGSYFVVGKGKKKQNKTMDPQEDSGQLMKYASNLTVNDRVDFFSHYKAMILMACWKYLLGLCLEHPSF